MHQSPINLRDAVDADLSPIEFHYAVAGRDEINNGHTIQIDYEPGSWVTLEGNDYELKQFHFHTPSENHMTTPPCSEGVVWLVMKQPLTASSEQIAHFARVMHHPNNRPIQPINDRVVLQ